MKTVAIPDCFRGDTGKRKYFSEEARRMTGAERVIWLSTGGYETDGNPAERSVSAEAEMLVESGADLVLVPTVIASLDREGTEIFTEAALISRFHCVDEIALPMSGKTPGEELRRVAMFLFQEPRDFQKDVKKERAAGKTTEEAKRICAERFVPGAGKILDDPLDRKSVEFLKCMYQLYLCVPVSWIPECEDDARDGCFPEGDCAKEDSISESKQVPEGIRAKTSLFERSEMDDVVYERLLRLGEEGREKFTARVKDTAGGTERIRKMAEQAGTGEIRQETENRPEDETRLLRALLAGMEDRKNGLDREESVELRKFLLRLLAGIRMADGQMCAFYICCPYALIAAAADEKDEWLEEVRKTSWVPLLTAEELRKKAETEENTKIFIKIEEAAAELAEAMNKGKPQVS